MQNIFFKKPLYNSRRGFTLLETVVALGVIVGGVAAATTLSLQVIGSVSSGRNQLTAINLAQEGIELVRQIRDTNEIQGVQWDGSIAPGGCTGDYQIDVAPGVPTLATYQDRYLQYPDSKGIFGYSGGAQTLFKRKITIEKPCIGAAANWTWWRVEVPDAQEMRIISTVTWRDRLVDRSIQLEEVLYDWR